MSLDDIRKQIDKVDSQLLDLLSERADLVHQVGQIKNEGLQIYAPEREDALLKKLLEKTTGDCRTSRSGRFSGRSCRRLWRWRMI